MAREFTGELDHQPTGGTAREFTGELDPAPVQATSRVREFTGELDVASPAPAKPRRGGTRAEAPKPFVADPEAAAAAKARTDFAATDPRRTDAQPPEDRREFSLGQVGKDFRGGIEQVKALATGAGAFGGAVDWKAATEALADLDEIEAGRPPRAPMVPSPTGGAPRPGEPTALAKAMQAADSEGRKSIRDSLTQALQRDEQFIARSVEAIKAYGEEQRKLSGKLPDFTDVRDAKGFAEWAVRNGAATAPTMAASMLAAAAGIINPAAGMASLGAVSGGMALGDMTAARAGHAAKVFEPDRFTNPDRIAEAEARQDSDTARHLADNVGATAALAVPYAALDFLGPAGTLARTGAKGLAKGGAAAIATQGAKEMGKEAINEGGQEVVNIAADMLAGERQAEVTSDDLKRVANAAAVGGLMGGGGHAANVAGDVARGAMDKSRRTKAAEAGDVEEALMLAIEASPYGAAKARGFVADPPLLTDPPTKQRSKTEAVFREVAASYGMSPKAVDAALKEGEGKPLDVLGGFYARAVQALQGRGLVGKPVDPEVLEALASGPVDPGPAPAAAEDIEPEQPPTEAAQAVENIGRILGAADGERAPIAGEPINRNWTAFAPESGTLAIPREQMPQVAAEHRGALVNFLGARGVTHEQAEVPAESLKPTQLEYSTQKVKAATEYEGGDRSILVSADGYVLDGHHQWLAKLETGDPVKVIRLDAPIQDLLRLAHQFPSSTTASARKKAGEADPADVAAAGEGAPVVSFKTEKGSVYQVNGASTTRNKAARADVGHEGDAGLKPPSERTFYVDEAGALSLSEFQTQGGKKSIVVRGQQAAVRYDEGPTAGKLERRTLTEIHDRPAVGLTPVELWNGGREVHFGNRITEITTTGSADAVAERGEGGDSMSGNSAPARSADGPTAASARAPSVTAATTATKATNPEKFAGRAVTQDVLVADTGQTARMTIPDAARALRELAARRRALQELRTCLGRRG